MPTRLDGLIIPGDAPPSGANVKRQILFFDSVTLIHPEDSALVNEDEIKEQFSRVLITWAPRNDFPRTDGYLDAYRQLIADTGTLQSRGIVRVARRRVDPSNDPGMNYVLWATAIPNKSLIEASAPDRVQGAKPTFSIAGYMDGLLVQGDEPSKYAVNTEPAYELPGYALEWTLLARLRLGRAIKFVRMAHAQNLSPLALDSTNGDILNALSATRSSDHESTVKVDTTFAASLEVFDPAELERALNQMSWADVARLRKEVLPGVSKLRQFMFERAQKLRMSGISNVEWAREQIRELQVSLEHEKEELAEEWEKFRIASVLKSGGVIGGVGGGELLGLISYFSGASFAEFFLKMVSLGLVSVAALSPELKSLLPVRRRVVTHPLYFVDSVRQSFPR